MTTSERLKRWDEFVTHYITRIGPVENVIPIDQPMVKKLWLDFIDKTDGISLSDLFGHVRLTRPKNQKPRLEHFENALEILLKSKRDLEYKQEQYRKCSSQATTQSLGTCPVCGSGLMKGRNGTDKPWCGYCYIKQCNPRKESKVVN